MFYSHEILTSRKHGVATIWQDPTIQVHTKPTNARRLVATLGSKSSLKKVSRRAILDVDVIKACETIADPDSPMALRLQSSLLYGVSRVFSQQCGYILTDTQSLHDKMRGICMVTRDLQIDRNVALTSSDQLNLPVDPAFSFDLDMGLDLSAFDILSEPTERSSLLSPHSFVSSQSSLLPEDEVPLQLELPSIGTPGNGFPGFDLDAGMATNSIQRPLLDFVGDDMEEPGIDQNPLFEIDEEGMIVDKSTDQVAPSSAVEIDAVQKADNDVQNEVRADAGHVALADIQGAADISFDDNVMMGDDDDLLPPPAPPLSTVLGAAPIPPAQMASRSPSVIPRIESDEIETETTVEAPQGRARPRRGLQADQSTELSNRQLAEWQDKYLETMAQARSVKANKQSLAQAKRNALFWVFDQGIGGAWMNFGDDRELHPLSVFSGEALMEALTGMQVPVAGRKRSHSAIESEDDQEDEIGRRVRREPERNIGSDDSHVPMADRDDGMLFQDGDEVELQVGRQPASSLKDHPSSMPWNLLGSSRQGSIQGSARPGFSSSIRGIVFDIGPPSGISGRRSRLTSASPLVGRGRPPSRLASLDPQHGNDSFDLNTEDFADPYAGLTGSLNEDFELYGPAAVVSTQQAAQSQWLVATLENEAHNFLFFLEEQIVSKVQDVVKEPSIIFAILLPPTQNSNVVAAQGILHVLALATKGLINVQQEEAFGDISLSIVKRDAEDAAADDDIEAGESA